MTELVRRPVGALAIQPDQRDWTQEQRAALESIGIDRSVPPGVLRAFLGHAQRSGLDVWARQLYLINRGGRWVTQTGIDGYRLIAERTGQYDGQTNAEFAGADGQWVEVWLSDEPPLVARIGIYKKGVSRPTYASAYWREYAQYDSKGKLIAMWARYSTHMLAKCAESLALRKTFPADLAGIYTTEELPAGRNDRQVISPEIDADWVDRARSASTADELRAIWAEAAASSVLTHVVVDADTGETAPFGDYLQRRAGELEQQDAQHWVTIDPDAAPDTPATIEPDPWASPAAEDD
jgi:phage recombination protein Bet